MYSRSVAHAPRIFCRATVPWGGVVPKVHVDAAAGAGIIEVRGATSSDCVAICCDHGRRDRSKERCVKFSGSSVNVNVGQFLLRAGRVSLSISYSICT